MLVSNPAFTRALINNGLIIVVSLLVQLPLALGVALLIAGRMTGAVWFRMMFFLPYILADVAAGLIWRFMLDGQIGLPAIVTQPPRAPAVLPAREHGLGLLPPC